MQRGGSYQNPNSDPHTLTTVPSPRPVVLSLVVLCLCGFAWAEDASSTLRTGVILRHVVAQDDASQSYALYLPTSYDSSRPGPILYVFDPDGRGAEALEHVRAAAERYGYVLACTNNSKNGPIVPSLNAAKAVWKDTHQRLVLDEHRAYTAGLSGGARVATMLVLQCPTCFAGVAGNGAGLPVGLKPTDKVAVPYFLAFGDSDFNYPELTALAGQLESGAAPFRVREFMGGHQWAPAEVWDETLAWFTLISRKGTKPDAFVEEQLRARQALAEKWEASGELLLAVGEYRAILRDFSGLDLQAVQEKLRALASSKTLAAAKKRHDAEVEQQRDLQTPALRELTRLGDDQEAFDRLSDAITSLLRNTRVATGREKSIMRRALNQVWVALFEGGQQSIREHHYAVAVLDYRALSLMAARDNRWPPYWLARAYAGNGEPGHALASLQEAVRNGFDDPEMLLEPEFAALQKNKEFQALVEKVKGPARQKQASP